MQIGDKVQILGTLVDIKEGKDGAPNSCLIKCDDDREYWALEKNVSEQPQAEAPAPTAAPAAHHEEAKAAPAGKK